METGDKPLVCLHGEIKTPPFGAVALMNHAKKKSLESRGWKVGSTDDFLGLSREEAEFIRMKLALSACLKAKRSRQKHTQNSFAKMMKSSQSRIAKMEKGDPSVSLDLLIHSLLALGTSPPPTPGAGRSKSSV